MNPNQPIINPSQGQPLPTTPAASPQPQMTNMQTPAMPQAPFTNPMPANTVQSSKNIRRAATTAIILGVLVTIVGFLIGLFFDAIVLVNILFGIVYVVFGLKLRKPGINTGKQLAYLKVLSVTVAINMLSALLSGGGIGFLSALLLYFILQAAIEMYDAGLTTSKSVILAKPKD